MKLYENLCYREIIKNYINERNRFGGEKLTYQSFAEKLRIQKSYLSKILKGDAELSKDQAYLCAHELELDEEEREYFHLLIDCERSALPQYKKEISSKIKNIQLKKTQSDSYLVKEKPKNLDMNDAQKYYLYPEVQLIHLSLGIKKYQDAPEKLMQELSISQELFQNCIKTLEALNLIEFDNKKIKILKSNMHLSNESPLFHQWHLQFKLKSLEQLKNLSARDKYNFLVSFSASEEDKEKIRIEFLHFLNKVEKIVKKSKSENLYQMNFDLFNWL